jgi:hypothetical protein
VRTLRVEQTFETDETVREKRAKDKVISMYNEERLREQREERKGLSLRSLFPKPRPIWHSVTLTGTRRRIVYTYSSTFSVWREICRSYTEK